MQNFPHHYTVTAVASDTSDVELCGERLPTLPSATPAEFDGPGDRWSPETLLVAAVGDCLALTFRGIARKSGLAWASFACDVTGTLDRVEGITRFVAFDLHARVLVSRDEDRERARLVLEKAERNCLIASSLNGAVRVIPTIEVVPVAADELTHICPLCAG
jgi:organic hydroperoxide reductase OsmC/OhrA